jgi:hypothetical protein
LHCKMKTEQEREKREQQQEAEQSKAKQKREERKRRTTVQCSAVQCSAATVLCKERRKFTNPFLNWDTLIRISKRGLARERARGRE